MDYYDYNEVEFSELQGKTLVSIQGLEDGSEEVKFVATDGSEYVMYHSQDCCESVSIESVVGDVSDLIGSPLLVAVEVSSEDEPPPDKEYVDSYTWTFYKLATRLGYVDIRWLGESNGYYSESVTVRRIKGAQQ